ncbi:hypothetical protein EDB86DRAFT_393727 [Lactarius hatsudake]|nr:hypothetical protein EDB86DRAFT_393727 [Lactarius hatsudake]
MSLMQFCLILSRHGSDLFQLSREYNVYASVKRNPLSLYLEGSRDSVKGAEEYIDHVRKGIVEDTFDTPSKHPIPQEAFHSISRLSGAFLEKTEDQKLRVRAKHPLNIMLAKRLAIRVNYQSPPSFSHNRHITRTRSCARQQRRLWHILCTHFQDLVCYLR